MDYSAFTNQFSLSKTLRFKLLPQGKTEENIMRNHLLEEDGDRAKEYRTVKGYIDNYHKDYIERKLSVYKFGGDKLRQYAELYYAGDREPLEELRHKMMKNISEYLQKDAEYKKLFGKEMIATLLPQFLTDEEEKEAVAHFAKFTTYFTEFNNNRKNMYTGDGKTTEIANRVVCQNLPKYLDNIKAWAVIEKNLPAEKTAEVDRELCGLVGMTSADLFKPESFDRFIAQSGIDAFNRYIGGYSNETGSRKIQGLNETINLFNQENKVKIPKLKPLFKQILSDRETVSFIPEAFENDNALLASVREFTENIGKDIETISDVLTHIGEYDASAIYVRNDVSLTTLSSVVFGDWSVIKNALNARYEKEKPYPTDSKKREKYEKDREKYFKEIKSFSLKYLFGVVDGKTFTDIDYREKTALKMQELVAAYDRAKADARDLLQSSYPSDKKLAKDDISIAAIKALLDSFKALQNFTDLFLGCGEEADKDAVFYGAIDEAYQNLSEINFLYDKVRNYITKKPYSNDKCKLNFNNPQLLGGWDKNKESDYSSVLMRKDGKYYLGIMYGNRNIFKSIPTSDSGDVYTKIIYKLLPGPNKMLPKVFFADSNIGYYKPSSEIMRIYEAGTFKSGEKFTLADCRKLIDFFKECIGKHPDWSKFGFCFRNTEEYANIADFYKEVHDQGYSLTYEDIPASYINEKTEKGELYLFEIYCKDFSSSSHGTPNMHTLYFKSIFDKENLKNVCVKMNGEAEMFYRAPSLKRSETTIHKANEALKNKNPLNNKEYSMFAYDLVKDKRYTSSHYELHLPITLNYQAGNFSTLNETVQEQMKSCRNQHIIGIDRGERNLLYVTVIDESGTIKEQCSLNIIRNEYNGNTYETDYQKLLVGKAADREQARKEWKTIGAIKDLKEGYLSQAVHKICEMAVKYNAVIVMENLNAGFKNTRSAVESSVYQKFEKMLTDKLAYLADKRKSPRESGGILNAYQLAFPTTSYSDMRGQNGIIFYIPAWNTSKIDPTTGFVDMLKPKYETVEAGKEFFGRFRSIRYNKADGVFEFEANMNDFPKTDAFYRKDWTICTNGQRIRTYRDAKTGEWVNERVNLTEWMSSLLKSNNIPFESGEDLKNSIVNRDSAKFYCELTNCLRLTLQMRNSIIKSTAPEDDYLISPVRNEKGVFYDSRNSGETLPKDADANGAYNIAREGLLVIETLRGAQDGKPSTAISHAQWLKYAQTHFAK